GPAPGARDGRRGLSTGAPTATCRTGAGEHCAAGRRPPSAVAPSAPAPGAPRLTSTGPGAGPGCAVTDGHRARSRRRPVTRERVRRDATTMRRQQVPEHEADGSPHTATPQVADFLRRRREQIAQRWADEPLFRTVFTVSRDEAVEAGKAVVDALAEVADTGRVEDPDAAGFSGVREQLARMGAARSRAGLSSTQVSSELSALWPPAENLLVADLEQADPERVRTCSI